MAYSVSVDASAVPSGRDLLLFRAVSRLQAYHPVVGSKANAGSQQGIESAMPLVHDQNPAISVGFKGKC
jgi:hypothetical protein